MLQQLVTLVIQDIGDSRHHRDPTKGPLNPLEHRRSVVPRATNLNFSTLGVKRYSLRSWLIIFQYLAHKNSQKVTCEKKVALS